jgi:hypothetical protein
MVSALSKSRALCGNALKLLLLSCAFFDEYRFENAAPPMESFDLDDLYDDFRDLYNDVVFA